MEEVLGLVYKLQRQTILKRTVLTCNEGKPEVDTWTQSGDFWRTCCIFLNTHFKVNMCLISMGHCKESFKMILCQIFW